MEAPVTASFIYDVGQWRKELKASQNFKARRLHLAYPIAGIIIGGIIIGRMPAKERIVHMMTLASYLLLVAIVTTVLRYCGTVGSKSSRSPTGASRRDSKPRGSFSNGKPKGSNGRGAPFFSP